MLIQVLCQGGAPQHFSLFGPWFALIKIRRRYGKNMPSILPGTYLYPVQMSAFGELFMDSNDVAKRRPNMRQL